MKWAFYVIVLVYMFYRAVYGIKLKEINSISIEPVEYEEESYMPPNSHKTISCKYSNKNQKVEWYDPSDNLVKFAPNERISIQKHTMSLKSGERLYSLLLTFSDTQVEDTGAYTCKSGDISDSVDFCVIGPADFVDTPTEVTVEAGRHFTLSCQARGQPEPRIVWIRNGEVMKESDGLTKEGKYEVMTRYNIQGFEGLLNIYSVTPEDAGIYSCVTIQEHTSIDDCSLNKALNISVAVNYKPTFAEEAETVYGKYNESIELVCSAGGYPVPEYRWFHSLAENSLYEFGKQRIKLSDDKTEARITLVGNSLTFGQTYICAASNDRGEARKEFTLMKIEKPLKPSEITVLNATDTIIDLNITWSEPVIFPIENFIVNIMPEDGRKRLTKESDWKKASTITLESDGKIEDEGTILQLTDLEPELEYWVRIRAANELGTSPWSSHFLVSTQAAEDERGTSTEANLESGDEDKNDDEEEPTNDTMFYGIFFAGGILVLSFACMVIMRLV